MSGKRPPKTKSHIAPHGDLIALGKQTKPEVDVPRPGMGAQTGAKKMFSSSLDRGSDRKREAPSTSLPGSVKRPKILPQGQTFTPLGRHNDGDRKASPTPNQMSQLDDLSVDVESVNLLEQILDAEDLCNDEKLEGLFLGAVKHLRTNRSKPDTIVYLTLMYLAKTHPSLFNSELIIQAFSSLLKRDVSLNFKSKGNVLVSVFACNVLMAAFAEEENWPDDFVKVFVEDSLGERVWVDHSDCKSFVDNIVTAFNTKLPPSSSVGQESTRDHSGAASPVVSFLDDEDLNKESLEEKLNLLAEGEQLPVFPRFPYQQDSIESYVLDIIREQLNRRQAIDNTSRNIIRLLTSTCGYSQVRILAAQKIEMWLQNPKLTRCTQELLMSVCMNCSQQDHSDTEVVSHLVKIRMKTKPLLTHFLNCVRELLTHHIENLRLILTHTIYNELSNARNPNNMGLINVVFQTSPSQATKVLAEIFQDLLVNKEDYLRAVRGVLREIVRSLRHDINLPAFCLSLMQERVESKFTDLDSTLKERYVYSVADLVSLSTLLAITPVLRDTKGDKQDLDALHTYRNEVATIQRDSVWWLHTVVPKSLEVKPAEYSHCLRKVLFMENAEQYYNKDNWPPEADRVNMLRLASEAPVLEDTLMRVLVIGLSPDFPVSPPDAVELVDQLVKRAAALTCDGQTVLQMERLELVDALLNLCSYRHPTDISLPIGYEPPTLAISNLYWKSWVILLILSAFNPQSFGLAAWENYPTLKCLIEMVMTRNYKFPPPTTVSEDRDIEDMKNREKQVSEQEKQEILEFESHLAAATSKVTITEANSLLVMQLTSMNPNGIARQPPAGVLEQIRILNDNLHIGQMLCRSRQPDFLLDIIQRQGTSQSMPWLAELVEASEGSLEVLPVQCLCEFLLHDASDIPFLPAEEESKQMEKHKKKQKIKKKTELVQYLQSIIHSDKPDHAAVTQVLDYFLRRLSSPQTNNRALAVKGLSLVMSGKDIGEEMETDLPHSWLLEDLPTIAVFPQVRNDICAALRQACQIETDVDLVSASIIFLSRQALDQSLHQLDDLALDMAQLIVERTTVINHILPSENDDRRLPSENDDRRLAHMTLQSLIELYTNYLRKAKEPDKEAYSWSNTQDQIILQWTGGDSATMHVLVVHAMIILLTYGSPNSGEIQYQDLLDCWFPANGQPPTAFLLDTSEEALLLPDWLKLRMIRSHVSRLVDTALQDIEPSQLLLFVQSFGIPVPSMSKLLSCLDNAVSHDKGVLEEAVEDKAYMAQLIDIQHMRGAVGGNVFHKLLSAGVSQTVKVKEDMEITEHVKHEKWKPGSPTAAPTDSVDYITGVLKKVFEKEKKITDKTDEMYLSLIKDIAVRKSNTYEAVLQTIYNLSQSSASFLENLCKNIQTCALLKILISQKNKDTQELLHKVMNLLVSVATPSTPVYTIARHFISSSSSDLQKSNTKKQVLINDFTDLVKQTTPDRMEVLVQRCLRDAIGQQSPDIMIDTVCHAMLESRENQRSEIGDSLRTLLTDWLKLLDPDLVQAAPELQQQILFAQNKEASAAEGKPESPDTDRPGNRAYLLALLTHQSSWPALHRCINAILTTSHGSCYSPTTVLDFLWACMQIPKIWQGREHKTSKNQPLDQVLVISESQLETVVTYIIEEGSCDHSHGNQRTASLSSRVELLIMCSNKEEKKMKHIAGLAQNALSLNKHKVLYQQLLMELYAQCPKLLSLIPDLSRSLTDKPLNRDTTTEVDVISYRLLTSLGQAGYGKRNEERMHDANIACRKLAAQHPTLMLRQLPLMSAILKGKTQFKIGQLRHLNYLLLFTHALGLLEAMQPQVFRRENSENLADILQSYFALIQSHCSERSLAPIVAKFVKFLNNYVTCEPQNSVPVLQKHVHVLSGVSAVYPDLPTLKSLLAGLTLSRQVHESGSQEEETTPGLARSTSPWTVGQIAPYLHRIQNASSSEDILDVLHDLDETSKRKVDILEHFLGDLKKLLLDLNDKIRNTSYNLIMRYTRQAPRTSVQFLGSFLQCLDSDNTDVILSALKNLSEFCVLCQDHADVLLQKAFLVGTTTALDTSSYITDTLQALNLETAVS